MGADGAMACELKGLSFNLEWRQRHRHMTLALNHGPTTSSLALRADTPRTSLQAMGNGE